MLGSQGGTIDTQANEGTIAGVITGGGSAPGQGLTKEGTGTLTLTGANTYTGGTVVDDGALQLGDGGTTGSIVGNVSLTNSSSQLIVNRSDTVTDPGGTISGSGEFIQRGSGTTIFTQDNTYTGGTTIEQGVLQLGDGGTTGMIAGDVVNNGALAFNRSDDVDFTGQITGTGDVIQRGTGVLKLGNAANDYDDLYIEQGTVGIDSTGDLGRGGIYFGTDGAGATGGTLRLDAGGMNISNTPIQLNAGGGTIDTQTNDGTVSSVISGAGQFSKDGSGTLALTAENTYTGGTIVKGGTLQLGEGVGGGATGSIKGNVSLSTSNSYLTVNRSNDVTLDGVVSGAGGLNQIGTGTTILTGNSTYSGGTVIDQGVLQLGNGGTTGMITGNVSINDPNAALAFNHSNDVNFAGVISGTGDVIQRGTGVVKLTSGSNTYYDLYIERGTVAIDSVGDLGSGGLYFGTNGSGATKGTLRLDGDDINIASFPFVLRDGGGAVNTNGHDGMVSSNIGGAGGLTKAGNGTLTLAADSSYLGGTTIEQGTLQVGNGVGGSSTGSIGYGDVNIAANASLAINRNDTYYLAQQISGAGNLIQRGTGTTIVSGNNRYSGQTVIEQGTLAISATANLGTSDLIFGTQTTNGTLRFDTDGINIAGAVLINPGQGGGAVDTNGHDGSLTGSINGAGSLTKEGSGTLTLTGNSSYLGGTIVEEGALAVNSNAALGADSGPLTMRGDTVLQLIGNLASNAREVRLDAGLATEVTIDTGQYTASLGGLITGTSRDGLVKKGSGVLELKNQNNNFTGNVDVVEGTLAINSDGALGNASNALVLGARAGIDPASATLRLDADIFDLGSGRNIVIGENSLSDITIDTQGYTVSMVNGGSQGKALIGSGNLHKIGSGVLKLYGNSTYTGDTFIEQGTLQVNGDPVAGFGDTSTNNVTIFSGARLEGQGTVGSGKGTIINRGTIAPGQSDGEHFQALTIHGDYRAEQGAVVEVNAVLFDDYSEHGTLIIDGDIDPGSVATGVQVINRDGLGALTDKGIEIIRFVNGASPSQNGSYFSLLSDFTAPNGKTAIVAGAWAYWMEEDNLSGPSGSLYLRDAIYNGTRIVNPGTPVYEMYPMVLGLMNRMPTLLQRVGNRNWNDTCDTDGVPSVSDGRGVWARAEGSTGYYRTKLGSGGVGDIDLDFGRINFGLDLPIYESEAGSKLVGGVNVGFGKAEADLDAASGKGKIDTTSQSLGATLTWYDQNGFYLDGQFRYTWFDSDLKSTTLNTRKLKNGNDADGYAFSLESGFVIGLSEYWSLTPQAQLTLARTAFDDFTDSLGTQVIHKGDYESLEGRLGLALNYENSYLGDNGDVKRTRLYGLANVHHEFKGDSKINIHNQVAYKSELDESTWLGLAIGGSHNWADDRFSIYGEVGLRGATSNMGDNHELSGELGFRIGF